MIKNIIVVKDKKANSFALLKKFSQKFRSSGILQKVKKIRYNDRKMSDFKTKAEKLRKIDKLAIKERELKMGKKPTRR